MEQNEFNRLLRDLNSHLTNLKKEIGKAAQIASELTEGAASCSDVLAMQQMVENSFSHAQHEIISVLAIRVFELDDIDENEMERRRLLSMHT